MLKIIIRTVFALVLYGWQSNVHATEVWDGISYETGNGYYGSYGTKLQKMKNVDVDTQDDYRELDRSYETTTQEALQVIPFGVVEEAAFCYDPEYSEAPLSPALLKTFIAQQPNLRSLNLNGNLLRDQGISPICQLPLVSLSVAKNGITNAGMQTTVARLTALRSLDISENYFNMAGLSSLSGVAANLQDFRCGFIPLGDAVAEFVVRYMPNVQNLYVRSTNLSSKGLQHLFNLKQLKNLDISYNEIQSDYLERFIQEMQRNSVTVTADYMR